MPKPGFGGHKTIKKINLPPGVVQARQPPVFLFPANGSNQPSFSHIGLAIDIRIATSVNCSCRYNYPGWYPNCINLHHDGKCFE